MVYDALTPRIEAVQDLAARIGCAVRMDGEGFLSVYPIQSDSVATLRGGPEGLLVKVNRSQDYAGLYNRFVVDGTADSERPVRSVADYTGGPLRVGGPHGTVPKFYSSQMISTQQQADSYAAKMRDTQMAGLTTDLRVTCAPMPHLEVGDWATVNAAVADGRVIPVTGRVTAASLSGGTDGTAPMSLTLACSYADVQAAFASDSSLSLAGPIRRT
jgi:hypothetical protein